MDKQIENRINEIKYEILKLKKLSEIGIEIYKENKEVDYLHNAVFYGNEVDKLEKVLKQEYGIVL